MNKEDFERIEFEITEELVSLIGEYSEKNGSQVSELQPPYSVVRAMASAAAHVLLAFERGYMMNETETE